MLRRIATKWVLTVLAAVLAPFLAFAWYVDAKMAERHWETVRYYLLTMAGEAAERVDLLVCERQQEVELWTETSPLASWTMAEWDGQEAGFRGALQAGFDRFVARARGWDLLLAVNARGEMVVASTRDARGVPHPPEVLRALERDYRRAGWFQQAMRGEVARVDHHVSDLLPPRVESGAPHPENFHLGFAVPVRDPLERERTVGVIFALLNWGEVQHHVLRKVRPRVPVAGDDIYQSSYTWLWLSDANTIIAHPVPNLYGRRVSEPPVDLPQLVEAARSSAWGMYPHYSFRGESKNAAFKHCAGQDQGGFGWIVGVGIDDRDTFATVRELQRVLWGATGLVLGTVVVLTMLVARRTTRPIRELKEHTLRLAKGDLSARVDVRSDDELGDLGRAFNSMTSELDESRARLVKAEKDAAWREMARQVAHEIKNPLTPVLLSTNLLDRARKEGSPEFDAILERTVGLIRRQVEHMRAIATDFAAFAGVRKVQIEDVDLHALAAEVLELNAAWAAELGVLAHLGGPQLFVRGDRSELRRVLINLVSNALEAMPQGGELDVRLARLETPAGARVALEIADTGVGLSETARERLFEPYFTTRSHGTGLGLAISHRVVEELGGSITLEPRADARGTRARVILPERGAAGAPA
jgi:signal transduction histidine kinase